MTDPRGFTFRFAIRMPDGELYRWPGSERVEDLTGSSAVRDMTAIMDMFSGRPRQPETAPGPTGVAIFDNIKAAEALLSELKRQAAAVGVTHWGGMIVTQLCTPFTPGDPSAHFWPAVIEWMRSQGMEA